jgi:hypothetical protein
MHALNTHGPPLGPQPPLQRSQFSPGYCHRTALHEGSKRASNRAPGRHLYALEAHVCAAGEYHKLCIKNNRCTASSAIIIRYLMASWLKDATLPSTKVINDKPLNSTPGENALRKGLVNTQMFNPSGSGTGVWVGHGLTKVREYCCCKPGGSNKCIFTRPSQRPPSSSP